jgi:hypothetical protein
VFKEEAERDGKQRIVATQIPGPGEEPFGFFILPKSPYQVSEIMKGRGIIAADR